MAASESDASATRSSSATWATVAGVTALAAFFGSIGLGNKQLRIDEATSWYIAQLDWSGLWDAVSSSEANSGIYYALLRLWLVFGESELAIRSLSVLFGVATVPLAFALGSRLFGRVPAFVAAIMLGTNAFFIENIQDARGYAMATCLVTGASLLFVDLLWRPSTRKTIAYIVVGSLAVYAHFFSAIVLGAHLLSAVIAGPRPVPVRRLGSAFAVIAVILVPLVGFTIANDVGQIDWIGELTWDRFATGISELFGSGAGGVAVGYAALFVVLTGAGLLKRDADRTSFATWRYAFVLLWALAPIVVAVLVSFVKPIFQARYLMGTLPALALAAAAAVTLLHRKAATVVVVGLVISLILSLLSLGSWYADRGVDWAGRVDTIVETSDPDDGMAFYAPPTLRPYLYYAVRKDVLDELPELEYPSSYSWPGFSRTRYEPDFDDIAERASGHRRMWLITGVARDEPRQEELKRFRSTLQSVCPDVVERFGDPPAILYGGCQVFLRDL